MEVRGGLFAPLLSHSGAKVLSSLLINKHITVIRFTWLFHFTLIIKYMKIKKGACRHCHLMWFCRFFPLCFKVSSVGRLSVLIGSGAEGLANEVWKGQPWLYTDQRQRSRLLHPWHCSGSRQKRRTAQARGQNAQGLPSVISQFCFILFVCLFFCFMLRAKFWQRTELFFSEKKANDTHSALPEHAMCGLTDNLEFLKNPHKKQACLFQAVWCLIWNKT